MALSGFARSRSAAARARPLSARTAAPPPPPPAPRPPPRRGHRERGGESKRSLFATGLCAEGARLENLHGSLLTRRGEGGGEGGGNGCPVLGERRVTRGAARTPRGCTHRPLPRTGTALPRTEPRRALRCPLQGRGSSRAPHRGAERSGTERSPDGGARRALSRRDGAVPTRSRLPGASGGGGGQEGVKARPADSQLMGP